MLSQNSFDGKKGKNGKMGMKVEVTSCSTDIEVVVNVTILWAHERQQKL